VDHDVGESGHVSNGCFLASVHDLEDVIVRVTDLAIDEAGLAAQAEVEALAVDATEAKTSHHACADSAASEEVHAASAWEPCLGHVAHLVI